MSARETRMIGRTCRWGALVAFVTAAVPADAQAQRQQPGGLGTTPAIRAPSLDSRADTAPQSPAEIEADTLGPPVKTKTFRVGPDGKPK